MHHLELVHKQHVQQEVIVQVPKYIMEIQEILPLVEVVKQVQQVHQVLVRVYQVHIRKLVKMDLPELILVKMEQQQLPGVVIVERMVARRVMVVVSAPLDLCVFLVLALATF